VLGVETFVLFIGLLQPNTCHHITTTRGLTAYIIVVSLVVLPLFILASAGIIKLINKWRESQGMEKIELSSKIVEMSFASTGRTMNFYEDFYAVSIVSYIYF
jgi:hypothetical protein